MAPLHPEAVTTRRVHCDLRQFGSAEAIVSDLSDHAGDQMVDVMTTEPPSATGNIPTPEAAKDYMSYCEPPWIWLYNNANLLNDRGAESGITDFVAQRLERSISAVCCRPDNRWRDRGPGAPKRLRWTAGGFSGVASDRLRGGDQRTVDGRPAILGCVPRRIFHVPEIEHYG